jgi:hypothetical protein
MELLVQLSAAYPLRESGGGVSHKSYKTYKTYKTYRIHSERCTYHTLTNYEFSG